MTACEEILAGKKGFREEFLREEVRADFPVDRNRKKLWMVLLDLVLELDRAAEENGLRYFLIGGSLLGAVRHKGFIPWDDDMDVGMFREDYEKLLRLEGAFKAPYFLQTPENDGGYHYSYTRLRNSHTTAVTEAFSWQKMNQGIALDIFPLDPWIPEGNEGVYEKIKALNRDNSAWMRRSNPNLDEAGKARAASWSGNDPRENTREIDRLARQFTGMDCDYLSHAVINVDAYPNNYFRKEWFDSLPRLPFEGFMLPVPAGYDAFLTQEYGDYMQFPPVESRGTKHAEFVLKPDIPYEDYLAAQGITPRGR